MAEAKEAAKSDAKAAPVSEIGEVDTSGPRPQPTYATLEAFEKIPGIAHAFFTREAGYSQGKLSSCNMSFKERPHAIVLENRKLLAQEMTKLAGQDPGSDYSATMPLILVAERHTVNVAVVDEAYIKSYNDLDQRDVDKGYDGLVTKMKGVSLGIYTADCCPIFMYDAKNEVLGACHAGWKGALDGIAKQTVDEMVKLGAEVCEIVVGIGPCLHQHTYEVGPDFPDRFTSDWDGNSKFFIDGVGDKKMFDFPGYAQSQIERGCGINSGKIYPVGINTFDDDRFYSCRRTYKAGDGKEFGNFLSAIVMKPAATE